MSEFINTIKRKADREVNLSEMIKESFTDNRQVLPMEADQWIRVSSLGSICPREEVLCSLNNITRRDIVSGDHGVFSFEQGHATHWMFQSRLLPKLGIMIGAWRCTYCGTQYGSRKDGHVPRPSRCFRCGAVSGEPGRINGQPDESVNGNAFVYVEEWVGNYQHKIGGSPDGFMITDYHKDYDLSELTLLEFKSSNDNNFKKKHKYGPDFVHVIQAQLYMWLTGVKRGKIVYLNKNASELEDGLKEHDIEYDDDCIQQVINEVKQIRDGINECTVPSRVVCMTSDCPRANRCHVKEFCFKDE